MATSTHQNAPEPITTLATTPIEQIATSQNAMALVPTTIDGAYQLARWLSSSTLLPPALKGREADIFTMVCSGMELGLPPMAALRGMYIVNGRPALESKTKAALCLSRGMALYIRRVEYTPEATTWETMRRGQTEPVRSRYTRAEAIAAFLAPGKNPAGGPDIAGKEGPWRLYTQRMISHRALGWLCDDVYPDIMMGVATVEDFDADEQTYKPVGGGVDLMVAAPPPAAISTQVMSGAPATARPANEPTISSGPSPVDPPKERPAPTGAPLTEDEYIELVTKIGEQTSEKSLRELGATRINNRMMDESTRGKLLEHYEGQRNLIRNAAAAEKKGS